MTISFPSTSVNNDVSFFLDFEGMLPRDQSTVYREDLLVFRDKTDNTTISVADNGEGYLQAINSNQLYTGNGGYLSTTYDSALQLGTNPYTIEFIFIIPAFRASLTESILSVGAVAASNNWEIGIDNLGRPIFIHGTTSETATSATITDDILQHIAIVRTGTGANETKMYLNGVAVRTFTDDTDYNYTDGLFIGSDRAGSGGTQVYFKNVRISTVSRYTEDFTAPSSLSYVAIGDTYSYLDKVYKWSGVKWFDRSKYNASIPGEFRNYLNVTASANTTVLDLRSANFFELDLVAGVDTEVVFENEALTQSFFVQVDGNPVIEGWIPIDEAVYETGKFKSAVGQDSQPVSVFFKPDGSKMYIMGLTNDTVFQYALSTPWDVSTAIFETGKFKSVAAQEPSPLSVFFKPDGIKMYILGNQNKTVNQYNLSTPWDVSTAIFETGKFKSVAAQDANTHDVFFKPDGTKMYILGNFNKSVYQYNLSTPWDVSTAIFETGKFKSVVAQASSPTRASFKPDGSKMYIMGLANKTVYQYNLSTPWDVSTAIFETGKTKLVSAQDISPYGIFFKPDGSKMYIMGIANKTVYQYNTSETFVASVTWPSNITWSTGAPPAITGTTLIEFYKYNGTWHGNVITENL